MEQPEITFEKLPEAVAALTEQVSYLRELLENLHPYPAREPMPMNIGKHGKIDHLKTI